LQVAIAYPRAFSQYLERFDLTNPQTAEDALLSIFESRRELVDDLEFEGKSGVQQYCGDRSLTESLLSAAETFWEALTPERAFLARVFADFCLTNKVSSQVTLNCHRRLTLSRIVTQDDARLEQVLPVVTSFAFKIQNEFNDLIDMVPESILQPGGVLAGSLDDMEDLPEGLVGRSFVVAELCKLAVGLDYADEIGRRKMFQLARESVSSQTQSAHRLIVKQINGYKGK